jgi:hypothetical protein
MDWMCGSSNRAPALQVQSPEFKNPSPTQKKKNALEGAQAEKWFYTSN